MQLRAPCEQAGGHAGCAAHSEQHSRAQRGPRTAPPPPAPAGPHTPTPGPTPPTFRCCRRPQTSTHPWGSPRRAPHSEGTPAGTSRGYRHPAGLARRGNLSPAPVRGCAGASVKFRSRSFPPSLTPPGGQWGRSSAPPAAPSPLPRRRRDGARGAGEHPAPIPIPGALSSASPLHHHTHNFPNPATPRAHSPAPRPPPPALPAHPPGSAAVCSILPPASRSRPCERALGGGGGERRKRRRRRKGGGMKAARAPPRSNPPSAPHARTEWEGEPRRRIPVLHPAAASRSGARGSGTSSRRAPLGHGLPRLFPGDLGGR